MTDQPPTYVRAEPPPPVYTFPQTFLIGSKATLQPLVQPEQLKFHLRLLQAFWDLRVAVEERQWEVPHLPAEKELRWAWFVHLAVERFERWIPTLGAPNEPIEIWVEKNMPPLDVFMVWHAYSLNPGWYSEDRDRFKPLQNLPASQNTPIELVAFIGNLSLFNPSPTRATSWLEATRTPFDPFESASQLQSPINRDVNCPECEIAVPVEFLTADGKGYAQRNFKKHCDRDSCNHDITKDSLAAAKFARDLARDYTDPSSSSHGYGIYLAGTLYSQANARDAKRAKLAKSHILGTPKLKSLKLERVTPEDRTSTILKAFQYTTEIARATAARGMKTGGGRLLLRIMSAYTDDRPFSIELTGAVLRQGTFVKKMHDIGWTDPDFFNLAEDMVALQHSIARYHAFLDLMSASPGSFLVPTLDIDLAWHTHQLYAARYAEDCKSFVGKYVDHDDKVEENRLAMAFDLTCRAWKNRYEVPYTHCGCPLPGDTIGQRLARLRTSTLSRLPSVSNPTHLCPPSNEPFLLSGTHPSDHNAVYLSGNKANQKLSDINRHMRSAKVKKRRERDAESVRKGKLDEQRYMRGEGHDTAFLVPVPMYVYGPTAGCVGGCGAAFTSGGCAAGAGGCSVGAGCGGSGGCGSGGCGNGGGCGGGSGGGDSGGGGGGGSGCGSCGSGCGGCGGCGGG
ncbi:hypothetical protein JAAARDRAFT_161844 [Jaapia argillacea MUCL 33604]|uniref:Uncharacterized protein n=1 Tax=Jaapia argillacea MUCL 33604 TaxID=933084 RepID=A0A067PPW8_9AGAM|nr:hypothetical protein JAAARDRAFT_161844 [Jaapia argillacea MUCL 33604]